MTKVRAVAGWSGWLGGWLGGWPGCLVAILLTLAGIASSQPAGAQMMPGLGGGTAEAAGAGPTALELRTLVELLEDPEVRAWLKAQVEALEVAPNAEEEPPAMVLDHALERIETRLNAIAEAFGLFGKEFDEAFLILGLELEEDGFWTVVLSVLVFLAIGFLLEWLFSLATRRLRTAIVSAPLTRPNDRLRMNLMRLLLALLGVGAFVLGSVGAFLALDWTPVVRLLILTYLAVFVCYRVAHAFGRFAFSPRVPRLRLLPQSTPYALFLHRWTVAIVTLGAFGILTAQMLSGLGVAIHAAGLLWLTTGLVLSLLLGIARLRARRLKQAEESEQAAAARKARENATEAGAPEAEASALQAAGRKRMRAWLFAGGMLLWWVFWMLNMEVVSTLLLVAILLPPLLRLCTGTARGMVFSQHRDERELVGGEGEASPDKAGEPLDPDGTFDTLEPPARMPLTVILIERLARAALLFLAGYVIVRALEHSEMALGGNLGLGGETIFRGLFTTLIAFVLADALWQIVRHAVERRLAEEGPIEQDHGGEGGGGSARTRVGTLLPMVRSFVLFFLVVTVLMIALSSFGVDIGPLLAGAGVVGIAIGFGAQALVRDIFSGIFFLLDDAFRLGEYVEIDALRGTVEGISIRSMRLRHHRGAVHTVPYGEIRSITNYSRDWVIMKLEFRVPYDTDLALVKRLVKQIGKELAADPILGPNLLEPLKSQGVRRVEEFNMVLGVKFMAKPGEQFVIRREAYQRILQTFEENGIRLASREVKLAAPPGRDEDNSAATAAAVEATFDKPVPGGSSGG